MRRASLDADNDEATTSAILAEDSIGMDLDLTLSQSEDGMLDIEEEGDNNEAGHLEPPPRIAARLFYRPTQARRRDSAASSRRGSISSAHSRCSSLQGTNRLEGDQSKHIAQHLRRATFLEDRRARLADRAAHAEKVRLRAAIAKATPRAGTVSSEERALAAQQAREKNLAKIVADCAEEVQKAKQRAETIKEKREQDNARLKAQMQERMAEAERRREELRIKTASSRRSRGQSVVARKPSESPTGGKELEKGDDRTPMSKEAAASNIAWWWRSCLRRKTIQDFNNLGLSVDSIRDTSFDTVAALLSEHDVRVTTARSLRLCGLYEGQTGSVDEMVAVRTFLSAFLILGHPNQVLNTKDQQNAPSADEDVLNAHRLPPADLDNPQLQELVGKAKDLLVCFETVIARLTASNRYTLPPALVKTLPEVYSEFYNAFIAWKSRDANAMVEVMVLQFVELDAILHTVQDKDEDAAEVYRHSVKENQLQLLVRIKRLAGKERGMQMVTAAVREARRSRQIKKKTGDTKPRIAESPSVGSSTVASNSSAPAEAGPHASDPVATHPEPLSSHGGLGSLLPDNRIVVHELAINKEYQVPTEEYKAEQAQFTGPFHQHMREVLEGADEQIRFDLFLSATERIKVKLQRLLKPGNSMHKLIGEVLDPEIARRQFTMGSFSYESFFSAMANLLPKLCAPFRDEELKELISKKLRDGHFLDRLEALNDFIDVMLCDYANYLLGVAAPQLLLASAQYETARFKKDLENGGTLVAAETAWKAARDKVVAETQRRDPEGINHPKSRPSASKFYAQMLVNIFTQPLPIKPESVPEMLQLDLKRIESVSLMVQRIITVGAVLLQCKNLLKRDVRSSWKTEASRIMTVLEAKHESVETTIGGTMAALEAGRSMPAVTKTNLRALVSKVIVASEDMLKRGTEPRDPVLRLLLTRLRGNILARITPTSASASEKVKAASSAGEKLASLGLSEFVDKVREISGLLDKVGQVDREAHAQWWDAVAQKVEEQSTAQQ